MQIEFAVYCLCLAIVSQLLAIVCIITAVMIYVLLQDDSESVSEATESDSNYDDSSTRNSMAAMNTSIQMMQLNTTMNGFM